MITTTYEAEKTGRLRNLAQILQTEIRGQNQVLPRVVSVVQRGEFGLTKPGRPRGSFLLLGPTGVGKTETVGPCFRMRQATHKCILRYNMTPDMMPLKMERPPELN